jgi:LysR family nitrogen assimilation transcriptional regulator
MPHANLEVLSLFVRAAELQSFSRVAVALGLSQPSVSRPIAELEARLGEPLFYRTGRGVVLTEFGELLLPRARALLDSAEQMLTDALAHGKPPAGPVTVAALPSMMSVLAPALYAHLQLHAPGIKLRILGGFSDQVERWLSDGAVDIGLFSLYRERHAGQNDVLFRAELVLISGASRPRLPETIPFEMLAELPLVLPSPPNGLRMLLEDTARKQKIKLNVAIEADSLEAQRELVRRCECYSVVADQAVGQSDADSSLIGSRITDPALIRYAVAATTHQRPLSRASRIVLQAIRGFWPDPPIASSRDLSKTLELAKHSLSV